MLSVQEFNELIAYILFEGNTSVSGMALTLLIGTLLLALIAMISETFEPKMMLLPYMIVAMISGAMGWIDTTIMIVIILICSVLTATLFSNKFSG